MKKHTFILSFFIGLCFGTVSFAGLSIAEEELLAHSLVKPSLARILDTHYQEIIDVLDVCDKKKCKMRHPVWEFPWLPGYIVKYSIDRLIGRQKVHACIKKHKLRHLTVPEKFLYHIKGRPYKLNNLNYVVIEKKYDVVDKQVPFSLEEVRQLCILIRQTGYIDVHKKNFLRLRNNTIAIVDTEKGLFNYAKNFVGLYYFIIGYGRFDLNTDFTEKALKHVLLEIFDCVPKDQEVYDHVCDSIYAHFSTRQRPLAWDYQAFFEKVFLYWEVEEVRQALCNIPGR